MRGTIFVYILVSGLVSYCIRALPLTLIRKPIQNRFLRSFLYYVPYVTLALMTFPAMIHATQYPLSGIAALLAGMVFAWHGFRLPAVASICCIVVFLIESFLSI